MSLGAAVTGFLVLALASGLYIAVGHVYDKYYDMNNNMITNDEYYSEDRNNAMESQFQAWYAFPVLVFIATIFYMIIEAIQSKDNTV